MRKIGWVALGTVLMIAACCTPFGGYVLPGGDDRLVLIVKGNWIYATGVGICLCFLSVILGSAAQRCFRRSRKAV